MAAEREACSGSRPGQSQPGVGLDDRRLTGGAGAAGPGRVGAGLGLPGVPLKVFTTWVGTI